MPRLFPGDPTPDLHPRRPVQKSQQTLKPSRHSLSQALRSGDLLRFSSCAADADANNRVTAENVEGSGVSIAAPDGSVADALDAFCAELALLLFITCGRGEVAFPVLHSGIARCVRLRAHDRHADGPRRPPHSRGIIRDFAVPRLSRLRKAHRHSDAPRPKRWDVPDGFQRRRPPLRPPRRRRRTDPRSPDGSAGGTRKSILRLGRARDLRRPHSRLGACVSTDTATPPRRGTSCISSLTFGRRSYPRPEIRSENQAPNSGHRLRLTVLAGNARSAWTCRE